MRKPFDLKPSLPADAVDAMAAMIALLDEYFRALPDAPSEYPTKEFVGRAIASGQKFGLQFFPSEAAFGFILLSPTTAQTLYLGQTSVIPAAVH